MHLHFVEDQLTSRLKPLTLSRPTDDLRTGILTIREKWIKSLNSGSYSRNIKTYMEKVFSSATTKEISDCLIINSRYLPDTRLIDTVTKLIEGQALTDDKILVAARVSAEALSLFSSNDIDISSLEKIPAGKVRSVDRLWDLLNYNREEIINDIAIMQTPVYQKQMYAGQITVHGSNEVYGAVDLSAEPGVTIIAEDGPVYIGEGVKLEAGAILKGPVSIGDHSVVKMNARIYGGTSIGPVCKVAGEISGSIFHSYSNKAHDGYVGDSLIGQWCNLGADTNTSNLKNNYSNVRIRDWDSGEDIDTGQQFLGTIMGDHSKTAINTMLNTGTVCGVCANIFTSGFPPKFIPSFSWLGDQGNQPYRFDKATEAMQAMMSRRDVELSNAYKKMMRYISESS